MRTGQVGEWSGNSKKASGVPSHHACQTRRGFVESSARKRLRVLCRECDPPTLRAIEECTGIRDEKENSSTYDVILEICGHQRSVTVAVEFTPSRKAKRGTQDTEIPETKPEDIEAEAIRADMESEQLL